MTINGVLQLYSNMQQNPVPCTTDWSNSRAESTPDFTQPTTATEILEPKHIPVKQRRPNTSGSLLQYYSVLIFNNHANNNLSSNSYLDE